MGSELRTRLLEAGTPGERYGVFVCTAVCIYGELPGCLFYGLAELQTVLRGAGEKNEKRVSNEKEHQHPSGPPEGGEDEGCLHLVTGSIFPGRARSFLS